MNKKLLMSLALGMALSGMVTAARADTITYYQEIYQAGSNNPGSAVDYQTLSKYGLEDSTYTFTKGGSATIKWSFDVKELGSAVLEIVAEGIDKGEIDEVWLTRPDDTTGEKIGTLSQQDFYWAGSAVKRGEGAIGTLPDGITTNATALTTTILNFDILTIGVYTIEVKVAFPSVIDNYSHSWVNEIETSTLTVTPVPEPTTILLLGTGLAGLAALSRKKRD